MSESIERSDDSPATWRDVREAVAAVIDFQMKVLSMTAVTMRHGRDAAQTEEEAVLNAASAIEKAYKLDELP